MKNIYQALTLVAASLAVSQVSALTVKQVPGDLSKIPQDASVFKDSPESKVELTGQAVVAPHPKTTTTESITVQAVHDGKWVAFRLSWADPEKSEGGPVGKYSDGVALEFPTKDGEPPSVMMGQKGEPVHIIHWKAQFQIDREKGMSGIKDIYPNTNIDMYPMDYKDPGKLPKFTQDQRDTYIHGRAAGNAQSYPKLNAVDEIFAEGFGTSQVREKTEAIGSGRWENGRWSVVIIRPLSQVGASQLVPGKDGNVGFAVWQGGKDEVGSRKSLTMNWEPVTWSGK